VTTDCLIIGFNDSDFGQYVDWVTAMGTDQGAYRDLRLACIEHEGRPIHAMDVLNVYSPLARETLAATGKPLNNTDFLWPTITYLATYLERRGFTWDFVNQFQFDKDRLREKLLKDDIRTIGITTTLYVSAVPILEIVSFIREYNTRVKIVIGGPYVGNLEVYSTPEALQEQFRYIGADFYVIESEGEGALAGILTALREGGEFSSINNIAYRDGDRYVFTAKKPEDNTLPENMPDYTLLPTNVHGEFVSLRTAKSCPYSCAFCGFPQRAGEYRYLTVDLVEKELDAIRDIGGVTTLTWIDDTFNVPKKRFQEILRMMIRNKYGYHWNSFYRSDQGDEETIALMAEAGCEGVFLGVESGSDETLKRMNKTARRIHYMTGIPLLRKYGIASHASVIIGYPGETLASAQETMDLVEESGPDFFRAQLWYADPVTPIWKKTDEYGIKGSAFNWSHNSMDFRVACEIVDRMFLTAKNSVWLPQFGFELWSIFYLKRKGLTLDQIKTWLRAFNAAIKEKLLDPSLREHSPAIVGLLGETARFDPTRQAALRTRLDEVEARFRAEAEARPFGWFSKIEDGAQPAPGAHAAAEIALPSAEELELLNA
jgi:anaerobic magnesium-protoporphyrin IX monomethyl ester cyclase